MTSRPPLRLPVYALMLVALLVRAGRASDPSFEADARPLIQQFCVDCHNDKKQKGDVNLDRFVTPASLAQNPKLWEDVTRVLRESEMPPHKKPQPSDADRARLIGAVEHTLAHLEYQPDPGRTVIRRLTRVEYNNTIRDLLGVDSHPADAFPADGGGGEGFDNHAATLYITPILMEKYLQAARQIAEQVDVAKLAGVDPNTKFDPHAAAHNMLAALLPRAFRRPTDEGEINRYLNVFDHAMQSGRDFNDAARLALRAVLVSPNFVYRIEADRPGATDAYPLNDFELATRLSYLLWSSMPDRELFDLAKQNRLHENDVLIAQVKRMLADVKSRAFAEQFITQWLDIRRLGSVEPDRNRYKDFTPELKAAMSEEPIDLFAAMLRDNAPLTDLIACNYTYLNAALAKHYGIAGVEGDQFRRVTLPDATRGGVLTLGAVLTVASYPQRTSPVLRGKWVLEQVLGVQAPPPPASVQTLSRDDKPHDGQTFRQRLERHRADPTCAACHAKIDPLGFGLENFDVIGAWRDKIGGVPVDAAGKMPTGETFTGPGELKQILLARREQIMRHLTDKMLAYALARGIEAYDTPVINKIMDDLKANDYHAQNLIVGIATSYPFTHRKNATITDRKEAPHE
ncbi:MAG: DUF1592 domain-containing protein [Planctomycetes bacterium]|nr:DUF1592 domain-containing protein [Planctomycetota bacterium]